MFPNKNRKELEDLEELALMKKHVEEVRLQDKFGKQIFHEIVKKLYEQLTDAIRNNSENLTKTFTEVSNKNNQALDSLNNKFLEILNDRGIIASYLLSPLSKITNPENTSQFRLTKQSNSHLLFITICWHFGIQVKTTKWRKIF